MAGSSPLGGFRVLEVGFRIASAYAAKCFAELGGDVVRIAGDDPSRGSRGADDSSIPALDLYLQTGKRRLDLDIDTVEGRERLRRVIAAADVLLCGHAPVDAEAFGLLPDQVAAYAPRTIVVNVTSFGLDGPYRDWLGDDSLLLALGGVMHSTGRPGREPLATFGHLAEYQLGTNAAIAALVALFGREVRGIAQAVDISGIEVAATLIENAIPLWTMSGFLRGRAGNGYYATGPILDIYPCSDGTFTAGVVTEPQWQGLCLTIDRPGWIEDPAWAGWPARRARFAEIREAVEAWAARRSKREVFDQLQAFRVPVAPHYTLAEILTDPQHEAREFFTPVATGGLLPLRGPNVPFRTNGARPGARASSVPVVRPDELLAEWSKTPAQRSTIAPRRAAGPHVAPRGVLEGVRILDLTQAWAGPLCTQLLADQGAQVIRVESASHPDVFRLSELISGEGPLYERGPFFHSANRNKLSLSLELATDPGRAVFADLVRASDVVIDNFSARVMRNFGFDAEAILRLNPRAIAVSMPAYGFGGPYENHVSYGEPMEGIGGLTALTGYRGEGPMRTGMAQVDAGAAFHAALAIMAALIDRERTGAGAAIDLSHFETCCRFIGEELVAAQLGTPQPERRGNRHPDFAPQGVYRCAGDDEWVMISVRSDQQWRGLVSLVSRAVATTSALDPSWNLEARRMSHDDIDTALAAWAAMHSKHEAMHACQRAGIPAAAVYKAGDIVADAHLQARGFVAEANHPLTGPEILPSASFHLSRTPGGITSPAPLFGEHSEVILSDVLGYPAARIVELREAGVVGRVPVVEGHTTI